MSMHKTQSCNAELNAALQKHRLPHDQPSQLADAFRSGWLASRTEEAVPSVASGVEKDEERFEAFFYGSFRSTGFTVGGHPVSELNARHIWNAALAAPVAALAAREQTCANCDLPNGCLPCCEDCPQHDWKPQSFRERWITAGASGAGEQEPASGFVCADCKAPVRAGWTCDVCNASSAEDAPIAPPDRDAMGRLVGAASGGEGAIDAREQDAIDAEHHEGWTYETWTQYESDRAPYWERQYARYSPHPANEHKGNGSPLLNQWRNLRPLFESSRQEAPRLSHRKRLNNLLL